MVGQANKLEEEHKKLQVEISECQALISSKEKILEVGVKEMLNIRMHGSEGMCFVRQLVVTSPICYIWQVIEREALALKKQFATKRRTIIEHQLDGELSEEDLVPNDAVLVVMSEKGYIKRMGVDSLSQQSRNTRGKRGGKYRGDDVLHECLVCKAHDRVLLFRFAWLSL